MEERNFLIQQRGQTAIEYILLLSVVMSLVMVMIKSSYFQELVGEEGKFATTFKKEMEYTYRHGNWGRDDATAMPYPNGQNPSYYNPSKGRSRFFGPLQTYPSGP